MRPRELKDEDEKAEARARVLAGLEQLILANFAAMDEGVTLGKLLPEHRTASYIVNMMNGIDRICSLPDDRDLTTNEEGHMQAALWQIAINSMCVLIELPFPNIHVKFEAKGGMG